MEGARVVVFEDNDRLREHACLELENHEHQVTAYAKTLRQALAVVEDIADGEIQADVVLLDGNLGGENRDCYDARQICQRMQERGVAAKVIGFSAGDMRMHGVDVDFDSQKNIFAAIDAIAEF